VEQIRDAARRLRGAGIEVGFFLQFGYPGETRADIERTRALVRECRPNDIGISVSYPLPGTPFHERVRAQMGAKRNWDDSADLAMMYRGPYTTAFYRGLHALVHAEFRLRSRAVRLAARGRPLRGRIRDAAAVVRHAAALPLLSLRLRRLERAPHEGVTALVPRLTREMAARPSEQA
jgi:anaerobic magnesium-protoporphyrin IX monomethyl ester cyclase